MSPKSPFINGAKQLVSQLLVVTPDLHIKGIGTMFIIGVGGKNALAFTARHCVDELRQIAGLSDGRDLHIPKDFWEKQPYTPGPDGIHHRHYPDSMLPYTVVSIEDGTSTVAYIDEFNYNQNDNTDLALVKLRIPDNNEHSFKCRSAITTKGPMVGDNVTIVGYPKFEVLDRAVDASQLNIKIANQMIVRTGRVIRIFNWGEDYLVRGPGFEIDIPAPSGTSGGPVFLNDSLAVCGLVSSSWDDNAKASILYPALSFRLNVRADTPHTTSMTLTLRDLVQRGWIDDHSHVDSAS